MVKNEIIVSVFDNIMETNLPKQCLLSDVLDSIKNPSQDFKSRINQIRKEKDPNRRNELKIKLLPVICFSGTFSQRTDSGLIELNPIICIDLDHVGDIELVRDELKLNPCVFAIFTSPTGTGLKVLVYHDLNNPLNHKALYSDLGNALGLMGRTDLKFDLSCSNVSRACFWSADTKLWINRNALAYHFIPTTTPASPITTTITTTRDITFPATPLTDYPKIREQIQNTHTLFEAHYSMYPGCRNKNLFILASFFRYDGIPQHIASDYLVAYYRDNLHGFPASEIRKTVFSAYN